MPNTLSYMLSYIIKGGLHTYAFFSDIFSTMTTIAIRDDPFSAILSKSLRNDIESFVKSFDQAARLSSTSSIDLHKRFQVTHVSLGKGGLPIEHECLVIWANDTKTEKMHEFVIERGPSYLLSCEERMSSFSQCCESNMVLNSIQSAIKHLKQLPQTTETDLAYPLLPFHDIQVPIMIATNSADTVTGTPSSFREKLDSLTTSLANGFASARTASQSISPRTMAADSISGHAFGTYDQKGCISCFEPKGLSLFEVALLTQVVHNYSPIYGLFDNQCYMFASAIFDSIVQLFSTHPNAYDPHPSPTTSESSPLSTPVPAPTSEANPPTDADRITLPTQSGRWLGLLIVDPIVKKTIVNIVVSKFLEERDSYKY